MSAHRPIRSAVASGRKVQLGKILSVKPAVVKDSSNGDFDSSPNVDGSELDEQNSDIEIELERDDDSVGDSSKVTTASSIRSAKGSATILRPKSAGPKMLKSKIPVVDIADEEHEEDKQDQDNDEDDEDNDEVASKTDVLESSPVEHQDMDSSQLSSQMSSQLSSQQEGTEIPPIKPKITRRKIKTSEKQSTQMIQAAQASTPLRLNPDELDKALLEKLESMDNDDLLSKDSMVLTPVRKLTSGSRNKLKAMFDSSVDVEEENPDQAEDSNGEGNDGNDDDTPAVKKKRAAKKKPAKAKTSTKTGTKTSTGTKKGPGRPRKTPKKEPIPRKGISKNPTNSDDHIEMLYDHPNHFKKIFQFFKALSASQIQIIFRPTDIIFYAEDHHKKSKIYIRIDAEKLNHYYCRSILDVGISSKEVELMLNKIDKEYYSIILLSSIGSTQKTIRMVLENEIQINEHHSIDLIGQYTKMENEEAFVNEDYTIKFQLPSKYFRKTINDIKTLSSQISITQEDSSSNMAFEYTTPNKKTRSKHEAENPHKIKLESKLEEGESFRVDIKIDHIKPIASAQIADDVMIFVDENKSLMTKAYINDGTIEIKTLTEIIDERPDGTDED